ncbi:DUF6906 family protein [Paenibacillus lutimineralis]|uniref:DUF6906 family protein n=1 Tax=Paenibacillus lutimineralis TaxID=2707005 RepID=UPI0018735E76|nr:hypothetical protein [Paenibacillus lutimineralis]
MGKQTRPTRPTRKQKAEMKAWKLVPENWLVIQDIPTVMILVSKGGLKKRVIRRGA